MRHKALSVRAPWAWLISTGRKRVELRKQRTHYRGPLLICASLRSSTGSANVGANELGPDGRNLLEAAYDAPRGVALCLVDVIDCRPATADDSRDACCEPDGEWAWVLSDPRPVERIAVSGKQGFFWVEMPDAAE